MTEPVTRSAVVTSIAATGPPPHRPRHDPGAEPVVLVDTRGRPSGTVAKAAVHHAATPLHLGFSCHVVAPGGRVLITRRAAGKQTWPATWTNACCGHPLPDETLRHAVERRLRAELGLVPRRLTLAVPDFVYRATMDAGTVEHEFCPVVVAEVDGEPRPDPAEVDGVAWLTWGALCARASTDPGSLSPWAVEQIALLADLAPDPIALLDARDGTGGVGAVLDRPVGIRAVPQAASPDGAPDDPVAVVRGPVERIVDDFLAERLAEVADLDPTAAAVADEVRLLGAAGGKRLRPAFAYWGHRATGAAHEDGVLVAAAALELLHSFALLHDDVMDRSASRRGRPTAHRSLAELHRRDGLDGDDGWFGISGAVLAGDLAFLWSTDLLDAAPLPPGAVIRARRVFTRLCTEVIAGQYLDLRLTAGAAPAGVRDGDGLARRVALLKSARYTVTRPLQLGAALADAEGDDPARAAALAAYGDAVGLAFQLRDDVLGLFGEPEVTGKSRLDDLREGKRTLLVVRALHLAPARHGAVLEQALGDPALDEATADRCREIVASSGALASVEALIAASQDEAVEALRAVPQPARAARSVVVVGAGLGGLSAACHLAGAGYDVTVVEAAGGPGGRAGLLERGGYRFDTGPTVLTMPHLVERCFHAAGVDMADLLRLVPVDPMYRAVYADGSELRVRQDRDAMTEEIRRVCGPADAAAFEDFCRWLGRLYATEMPHFIERNYDGPLDLVRPLGPALDLVRLGAFGRLGRAVARRFADDRLRRIFSFQSLYAGLAPYEALALYAVITYMDVVNGVVVPEGGMHALPRALAAAAAKAGADLRYDSPVERIVLASGSTGPVRGVRLAGGELIRADAVVCNPDLPVAYRTLLPGLPAPRAVRTGRYSPSAVVWHVGVRGALPPGAAHHNVHFGRPWDGAFRAMLREGRRMPDPSFLVSVPTVSDPGLAPDDRHALYVLEPVPNLDGRVDWTTERARARDDLAAAVAAAGYPTDIEVEDLVDPLDWEARGMERGTPFALAHTFRQTGPFRPGNVHPQAPGLVFAGSGTVPGVGVPMVLVSGMLAAQRVAEVLP